LDQKNALLPFSRASKATLPVIGLIIYQDLQYMLGVAALNN
jgi:hypothetical protein